MEHKVDVELRRHIGTNFNRKWNQVQEIEHDQYIVVATVNGVTKGVGYVGKTKGSQFNPLPEFESLQLPVRQIIADKLTAALGWEPKINRLVGRHPALDSGVIEETVGGEDDE